MQRVVATEVDVSWEKDSYILTGRVDLLLGEDDRLELLDFKSQPRPVQDDRPSGRTTTSSCSSTPTSWSTATASTRSEWRSTGPAKRAGKMR